MIRPQKNHQEIFFLDKIKRWMMKRERYMVNIIKHGFGKHNSHNIDSFKIIIINYVFFFYFILA